MYLLEYIDMYVNAPHNATTPQTIVRHRNNECVMHADIVYV